MKKKAFIIGPTVGIAKLNLPEFEGAAEELRKQNYNPLFVHDLFDVNDESQLFRPFADRVLCREMLDCELVVTLPEWDTEQLCTLLVQTARLYAIEVKSIITLVKETAKPQTHETSEN